MSIVSPALTIRLEIGGIELSYVNSVLSLYGRMKNGNVVRERIYLWFHPPQICSNTSLPIRIHSVGKWGEGLVEKRAIKGL